MPAAAMTIPHILQDLVRLPSINPMGRELPPEICTEKRVTDYLQRFFEEMGVPWERQVVQPGRENIIARWEHGRSQRTVLLEVHQDTVPVDNMTIEPFGGTIENGRLYGRGACDVKGGMTAMLSALARLVREQPAGAAQVILACTVDEEHTFLGVQELVRRGCRADWAIVAEPTCLHIVHAHKGAVRWRISTAGRSCHSSRPDEGINAVYRMGAVVRAVEDYARQLQASRSHPLLGPATLSVGRIHGGTSVNTVPDHCHIEVDRRLLPGEDPAQAQAELLAALRNAPGVDFPVECSPPWFHLPALGHDLSGELVERLGAAIAAVVGPQPVDAVPYGTDASTLALAGIPTVVFGPGDIACAHTRDESIRLNEVEQAAEILYRFVCDAGE